MPPKSKGPATPDPLDTLAVGLAADHVAAKAAKAAPPVNGAEATDKVEAAVITAATEVGKDGTGDDVAGAVIEAAHEAREEALENEEPATPAAPGEDAATVFDRRLERLVVLVDEAEFESGTAFGDLRDCMLDLYKTRPKAWSAMSQDEKQSTVKAIETAVKDAIRKVVIVIAQEEAETLQATFLTGFQVKGETIEGKIKIENVDRGILDDAFRLAGHRVVIISADDRRHSATRRGEVQIPPDQHAMAFAEDAPRKPKNEAPPPVEHPSDDSDLADGADARFRIYDEDESLYLDAQEDGWSANIADAGSWAREQADELAELHDAKVIPVDG